MGPIRRTFIKLISICQGWLKSYGVIKATGYEKKIAKQRLGVCVGCPEAKESKVLKLIRGKAEYEKQIACNLCSCPCNEKVLVLSETCPLKKW